MRDRVDDRIATTLRVAAGLVAVAVLAPVQSAGAATRVGDTFTSPPICDPFFTHLAAVSPAESYTFPFSGVVTSWSYQADATPPQVRFKVARRVGGSTFAVIQQGELETPAPGALHTSAIRVSVAAGDVIGLYTTNQECGRSATGYEVFYDPGDFPPGTVRAYSGPASFQPNISAVLEPDCDGDGFGDESQDQNVVSCDSSPPETTITKGPKDKTKKKTATFEFSGSDARAVAGFECSLDGSAFTPCTSPHTVKVKKGKHTFSVRAFDAVGNPDGSPATDGWKVRKKKKKKRG